MQLLLFPLRPSGSGDRFCGPCAWGYSLRQPADLAADGCETMVLCHCIFPFLRQIHIYERNGFATRFRDEELEGF